MNAKLWNQTALLLTAAAGILGCHGEATHKAPHAEAPAKVQTHPEEADLARVVLTAKAEARLGIRTAPVTKQSVPRYRTLGGIVVIPPGRSIAISAPWAATVASRDRESLPRPGVSVKQGEVLLTLVPLLSPDRYVPTPAERVQMAEAHVSLMSAQLVADGDTKRASEEVEAARIALDRAHRLFADKAGSARDVDDAQARLAVSQKTLESAMARRDGLTHAKLDSESGTLTPMDIVSPVDGLVVALGVAPSQTVAANTALVEVADTSTVWIRVPIYVGQLAEIRPDADVAIGSLRGGADAKTQSAQPIAAPPSADPQSSTVDVFYEMRNKDGALRPGARVGVTLPLVGEEESLVVPWAAILHDIHGSAWLYEKPQAQTYQRRRVEVRHVTGETAVLARGPDVGTEIVVDGAAELFGTEFGAGK